DGDALTSLLGRQRLVVRGRQGARGEVDVHGTRVLPGLVARLVALHLELHPGPRREFPEFDAVQGAAVEEELLAVVVADEAEALGRHYAVYRSQHRRTYLTSGQP